MLVLNQATANMGAACPCSGKWKPVSQWHSRHSVEQHGSVPYDEIGNSGITALWPSGDLCMKYRLSAADTANRHACTEYYSAL